MRSLIRTLGRLIHSFRPGVISVYAASATLFIIISFFPFMIILLTGIRFLSITQQYFFTVKLEFIPEEIRQLLEYILQETSQNSSTTTVSVAVISTLWSASSGMMSLLKGLNVLYNERETRRFLTLRIACIGYTVAFIVLILAVLIFLVFWNQILQWGAGAFPVIVDIVRRISYVPFVGTVALLVFFFTLLYRYIPNPRQSNRRGMLKYEIPGACFAAFGWLLFSKVYSLYISTLGRYSAVYGSLTAVVFMIIWLYACIYIVFIGAFVNKTIKSKKCLLCRKDIKGTDEG